MPFEVLAVLLPAAVVTRAWSTAESALFAMWATLARKELCMKAAFARVPLPRRGCNVLASAVMRCGFQLVAGKAKLSVARVGN
jgi:hypothetical protein